MDSQWNEETTLEELLDQGSDLNDFSFGRFSNLLSDHLIKFPFKIQKFIDFLIRHPNAEDLIVTNDNKYPFFASQVCTNNPTTLVDFFYDNTNYEESEEIVFTAETPKNEQIQQSQSQEQLNCNKPDHSDQIQITENKINELQSDIPIENVEQQQQQNENQESQNQEDQQSIQQQIQQQPETVILSNEKTEKVIQTDNSENQQQSEQAEQIQITNDSTEQIQNNSLQDQKDQSEKVEIDRNQDNQNDEKQNLQNKIEQLEKQKEEEQKQDDALDDDEFSEFVQAQTSPTQKREEEKKEEYVEKEKIIRKYCGTKFLVYLFDFLKEKTELNCTCCGYFTKALIFLITKNGKLWDFFNKFSSQNYLDSLLFHCYNDNICEIVFNLLVEEGVDRDWEESKHNLYQKSEHFVDYYENERRNTIDKIFQIFQDSNNIEQKENLAKMIVDISSFEIKGMNQYNLKPVQAILRHIYEKNYLEICFQKLNSPDNRESKAFALILRNIFNQVNKNRNADFLQILKCILLEQFPDKIQFIVDVLSDKNKENENEESKNSDQPSKQKKFGETKMMILQIITVLLSCRELPIYKKISETDVFQICLQFIISYPFNNLMHHLLKNLFYQAFNSYEENILKNLFQKSEIIDFVIKAYSLENQSFVPQNCKNPIRTCHIIFIHELAREIQNQSHNSKLKEYFLNPKWKNFYNKVVSYENKLYKVKLGVNKSWKIQMEIDIQKDRLREEQQYLKKEADPAVEEFNSYQYFSGVSNNYTNDDLVSILKEVGYF